ncbi:MAG: FAD binding domain-containing protein [Oscillospiraceae bacterium]|nr:FAD binding domain-containing protein [Oscillospiraceae bacterium]
MEKVKCFIPETLEEALRIRKETGATILAGGSDLMVSNSMGAGITPAFRGDVMIITGLKELKGITETADTVEIGALTTSAEIAGSPIAPELLKDAASRMGAIALRNSATIGGNIANASPKGDMPQPLILMDAEVVLKSLDGERRVLVDDFIIAHKKTELRDDEIITGVVIPKPQFTHIFYRKIGMRRANAISKLTLSAAATVRDGVLADFRASSGAAGPKVARSRKAEEILIGRKLEELIACKEEFLDAWNGVISPHAMPEYRRNTTRRMLAFFIDALAAGHAPGRVDIEE